MSANENLADRTITHAIHLERFKSSETQEVLRLLSQLERSLITDLQKAGLTTFRKTRYEKLLLQARETIRKFYRTIRDNQQKRMEEVADLESQWTTRSLNAAISQPVGVYLDIASVAFTTNQLKSIASNIVIDGSPAATWWSKQAADTRRRFADVVKQGLLRGQTNQEIIKAVRGSAAMNYTDGIMEASRRNAEALVRSSISAVTTDTRLRTIEQNKEFVRGYRQLSTLDSRTSVICIAYSGKRWDLQRNPLGHNLPMLPFPRHFNERSQLLPELKSFGELADRKLPQADNRTVEQLFRQKLREMGWDEERIAKARRRTQASMDGQVSVDEPFERFLERKGKDFQDKQLGKGKAELFRKGLITDLSRLVDGKGNPLTVKQLRQQLGVVE